MRLFEYPFVVLFLVLFVAFAWAGQLRSEDETEARIKASLALAKAARERAKTHPVTTTREQSDQSKLEEAWREAHKRGVPIVCWVAVKSDEYPEFRKSLGDVVHCELTSNEGSNKPRVLFVRSDKLECVAYCTVAGIRDDTSKKMWAVYREVMGLLPVSKSPAPQQVGYARPVVMPFVGGYGVGDNCST